VERKIWHPSQRSQLLSDGWLEIPLDTPGTEALKSWLYRWIPHFQVIQPKLLKNEMAMETKKQNQILVKLNSI
jgi:predicted DNA-binding transcriptional regulator YafY